MRTMLPLLPCASEIEAKPALHPSAALQSHVSQLGQRITAAAGPLINAFDFSFKVLQDPRR